MTSCWVAIYERPVLIKTRPCRRRVRRKAVSSFSFLVSSNVKPKNERVKPKKRNPNPKAGVSKGYCRMGLETSHTSMSTTRHGRFFPVLRNIRHQGFGGEHQRRDGAGVLQS